MASGRNRSSKDRTSEGRQKHTKSTVFQSLADHKTVVKEIVLPSYGLLGPSGCGKTTLINVLLGISKLRAGRATVKCTTEDIGYMPQDIALYEQFSIMETLHYYGHIYGMESEYISERTAELLSFLELPNGQCVISTLSGGEQRRVSLCVAILHNPRLLILDEPTVGIDPILSSSIWNKLLHYSKNEKKTILLTTHYVEETRLSDMVGMMRGGVMLTEAAPGALMAENNCDTLEQAFFILSKKQTDSYEEKSGPDVLAKIEQSSYDYRKRRYISAKRIWALMIKNFYWMKRNSGTVTFLMVLPLVQCVLMNVTVGGEPKGVSVAVVNDELAGWETACCNMSASACTPEETLSCRYIKNLRTNRVNIVAYKRLGDAFEAAKSNKVWGVVHFGKDYTPSLLERIEHATKASTRTLEQGEIEIWLDMSNNVVGNSLKRDITLAFNDFLRGVYKDCGLYVGAAKLPIVFNKAVFGSNNPSLVHFSTPAVIILSEFYFPIMYSVGAVLMDKLDGILMRSLVAGVKFVEILLVHVLVQYLMLLFETILMMVVLFYFFDNPLEGSIPLCLLLLFLVGTSGMAYGMFVAVACESFSSATFIGLGSYFPLFVLSGMIWPLQGMHYVLRTVGFMLPLSLSIESFRAISTKAWSIGHPVVYSGFISSSAWSCALSALTFALIKLRNDIRLL